jgi:ribonuclease P protein component
MLPKKNRLDIKTYFSEIRGTGKKSSGYYFSFYFRLNEDTREPQFNIIVSKKVAKSAVKRNRMRRLINAALHACINTLNPKLQGLFFVYKDFSLLKSTEITKIVEEMVKSKNKKR